MRWVLVVALVASAVSVGATVRPRTADADDCTPNVRFRAADGTHLAGRRFGTGTTVVVLAHQSDGELCQWASYGERLARLGYEALAFDFRGHGGSETRHYPANQRYGGDVAAAVRFARTHGARKVFLVGASLGGSAVVQAGANVEPRVDGVVSVSGAADLSDAIGSAPRLAVPVLFLAGKGDRDFAADARRLYAAAGSTSKRLRLYPSAAHGVALVAERADVRGVIEAFLAGQ